VPLGVLASRSLAQVLLFKALATYWMASHGRRHAIPDASASASIAAMSPRHLVNIASINVAYSDAPKG
jgi:hypothetical protein